MADISSYLEAIMEAVYGEDVRGSIHDAIEIINDVSEVVLTTGTAVTGPTSSSTGFYTDSLYLNISTMELWKCIGVNSWQSQGTLKGNPGTPGTNGVGISSILKTATVGLVDTYTITYTNGNVDYFTVTNGKDGINGEDGNKWYRGTGISGKSALPTIYTTSGVTYANENDLFLNPSEGAIYACATSGDPNTATWVYVMTLTGGGGGGGTSDYTDLVNKPQINGYELNGNQTAGDLGFATVATTGAAADITTTSAKQFVSSTEKDTWNGKQDALTIETTYSAVSSNPQAGTAVADALTNYYTKSEIDTQNANRMVYGGSVTYATLPSLTAANLNKFYLVTDSFTTTSDFVVGPGVTMPANSHIAIINMGTDLSPIYKYDDLGGYVDTSSLQPKTITSMTIKGSSVTTVETALTGLNSGLDDWTATALVQSDGSVTFTGLSDDYGYDLYCEDKLIGISSMTKTGTGSAVQIKYATTGTAGDVCKLRIHK